MFICLKELKNKYIENFNLEKSELEFPVKGELMINKEDISTIEQEEAMVTMECLAKKIPEELWCKFRKPEERIFPITKVTLKDGRQYFVKESIEDVQSKLSEKK